MTVRVYVADGCPFCTRLLADLARRRVAYRVVNVSQEPARLVEVMRLTWTCRVPVVVDHERFSVGFAGGSSEVDRFGRLKG